MQNKKEKIPISQQIQILRDELPSSDGINLIMDLKSKINFGNFENDINNNVIKPLNDQNSIQSLINYYKK